MTIFLIAYILGFLTGLLIGLILWQRLKARIKELEALLRTPVGDLVERRKWR
jgi:hypothetical protein